MMQLQMNWCAAVVLGVLCMNARVHAERVCITEDWRFQVDGGDEGLDASWHQPEFDDSQWARRSAGEPWSGVDSTSAKLKAWYRKSVRVADTWRHAPVFLGIEDVDYAYDLYINGHHVRGYTEKSPFARQATVTAIQEHLRFGEANCIALCVTGPAQSGGLIGRVVLSTGLRSLNWEPLVRSFGEARFRIDPDRHGLAQRWHERDVEDADWSVRPLGGDGWRKWEGLGDYKGEAWYRVPLAPGAHWRDEPWLLATPNVDGQLAMYLNGKLVLSRGFEHGPEVPRHSQVRLLDAASKDRPVLDISAQIDPAGSNVLVVRVKCERDRRGVRGPIVLAADRRALIFQNDWKAVTELAKAEPDLILPGWATGRGVTRTITGTIGGQSECFVAPDGSFSPANRSYGLTVWVYDRRHKQLHAGERIALADLQHDLDGRNPFPRSRWKAGDVNVETLLFAKPAGIAEGRQDLAFYRCRLSNAGEQTADLRVFVAIVPFSIAREYYAFARGYNPVRRLSYASDWNAALVNDRLGVVALRGPEAFGATSLVQGSFISEHASSGDLPAAQEAEDWAGLASGAFVYDLTLEPGKSDELPFVMPIDGMAPTSQAAEALKRLEWKKSYNEARDEWRKVFDQQAMKITLPEADIEEAYYASLAYALILKDGDGLIPGSFAYNAFWTRDAAYLVDACLRAGLTDTARKATELWVGFQKESGQFPSMGSGGPKEWDGQGQAMFSFVQVYRHTRDKAWLARHFDNLLRGARYIASIRRDGMIEANRGTPRWGILTPSVSAEDLGPPTWHFYWDNFWCIRGLQDALYAAEELQEADAASEIRRILEDLHGSTLASIRQVMSEQRIDWIPVAPESVSASGKARGTTPAVWPGGALEPDDPLVQRSFEHYWETLIAPKKGGYYHSGQPWPYATLELAHAYLNIGHPDRAYQMLRWTVDHQSAPGVYAWAEVADGGNHLYLGGDIPHGWACAEYISLVRDMLVREHHDTLLLTSGVPAHWLDHGKRVEVERAATTFGKLAYRLVSRVAAGEISLEITTDAVPPGGIFWMVPAMTEQVEAVVLDPGSAAEHQIPFPADRRLRIPAGVTRVVLRLQAAPVDALRDPYRARMQDWKTGMTDANVYASVDDRRPLMGVYFYFEGADARTNRKRVSSAREAFDFFQVGPNSGNVRRCEEVAMPWMGVDQPAIPLGRESRQWNDARGVIRSRTADFSDCYYLLGWNSGSEPHTSFKTPGYTGHTEKLYEELGVAAPTRDEFIEWLANQYEDDTPATDSNADGITFNQDFDLSFETWDAVAQPAYRRLPWFEHILIPFTCKLIQDAEAGRLQAFREHDPHRKVTPRLLRSLTDPRMSYDLTYLNLGDAAGVTFYCGGGFDMDDPNGTGARIETHGLAHQGAFRFGVRMTPPHKQARGLAQSAYRVHLPDRGPVLFKAMVKAEEGIAECRVELVEDLDRPESPGHVLLRLAPTPVWEPVQLDLSGYAGRRVWLRLVADPEAAGPAAASSTDRAPGRAYWLEPRLEAGGRISFDLVEFYKEARAGYRLHEDGDRLGPFVFLGMRGSMYQVWYADHVMSLVANRARLAGKRAVANEFHPGSGSPHAMFPLAIYNSMIRLMQFRVPSVAYFCHMYQGEFTHYSMANSEEHVARARNQAILWDAYPDVPERRRSRVACFMPSNFATPQQATEAAAQFGTKGHLVWAMGELGADFYLLNDLDQAADYDRIVIYLAYADREAEDKLVSALRDGFKGRRVLILTGVSRLWGPVGARHSRQIDRSLEEWLPVLPAGQRLVTRPATLMTGLRADLRMADEVRTQTRSGFEPMKADDGTIIGARSENVLVLAGFPDTSPADRLARGWFDTSLRRLVHEWLDVEPGLIDAGAIQILCRDAVADRPAIYCIENSSCVTLAPGLAAYDVLHQYPVQGNVYGPAVLRVWSGSQPMLADTDLCEPIRVESRSDAISATLVSPSALSSVRPRTVTFYWPDREPKVWVNDEVVGLERLQEGFYRFDAPPPGTHNLSVRAADR